MTTPGDTRISALPEAAHSEAGDYMAIDKAGGTARKLAIAEGYRPPMQVFLLYLLA
ncbi:MAG: hypothetical protein IKG18_08760 [Atopobiaceae bacterium]|nr:hypothetical protein [Atopobiaceae bacterium]